MRDPFSALSHFAGASCSLFGTIYLVMAARGNFIATVAFLIYGTSLMSLYLSSGIYHTVKHSPPILQKFDHGAIYFLIAGTYTPLCLLALPRNIGVTMLVAQVVLATIGLVAIVRFGGRPKWLRLVLYLTMGWMILLVLGPLSHAISFHSVIWLVVGGLLYSVGTIIYATKRPRLWPGKFGSHDLWHLFVLGGSAAHFVAMLGLPVLRGR